MNAKKYFRVIMQGTRQDPVTVEGLTLDEVAAILVKFNRGSIHEDHRSDQEGPMGIRFGRLRPLR